MTLRVQLLSVSGALSLSVTPSGGDYTSLGDAMSFLNSIPVPVDATIALASAHFTLGSAVTVWPRGRLTITGDYTTTTASVAAKISGAAGAWSVNYTLAAAGTAVVGDWLIITNAVGTGIVESFEGNYEITAVAGSVVTVTHTAQNAAFPIATLTSATVVIVHTVLNFNASTDGLRAFSSFQIDGVAIKGSGADGTVGLLCDRQTVNSDAQVSIGASGGHVCVAGFNSGLIAQEDSSIDFSGGSVANCLTYGALAQHGGTIFFNNGIANGNIAAGCASDNNGDIWGEFLHACCNGTYGAYQFAGGSFLGKNGVFRKNVLVGVRTAYAGVVRLGTGNSVISDNEQYGIECVLGDVYCEQDTIQNNGINGIQCTNRGRIYAVGAIVTGNTTHDISVAHGGFVTISTGQVGNVFAASGGIVNVDGATGLSASTPALNRISRNGTTVYNTSQLQTDQQTITTDAIFALTAITSPTYTKHTGVLTANRAVTLATTNAIAGDRFHITRTGVDAFNLNIGSGPLKAMVSGTWAEFVFDGTSWYLAKDGTV